MQLSTLFSIKTYTFNARFMRALCALCARFVRFIPYTTGFKANFLLTLALGNLRHIFTIPIDTHSL